jgi:hypothetical protein
MVPTFSDSMCTLDAGISTSCKVGSGVIKGAMTPLGAAMNLLSVLTIAGNKTEGNCGFLWIEVFEADLPKLCLGETHADKTLVLQLHLNSLQPVAVSSTPSPLPVVPNPYS